MNIDKGIGQAIDIGKRNVEIEGLVRAWCTHAKVERLTAGSPR